MRKLRANSKGQFVIIAVLLIALMIVSIGAVMSRAVTYYKHEPWEEYLTLLGNVEISSSRLVELSLANYTNSASPSSSILKNNLQNWQGDMSRIYPGYGITLAATLPSGPYNVYGATATYSYGLNYTWQKRASFSVANATFTLNVTSIGLTGYKYTSIAFLNLTILSVNTDTSEITVTVKRENSEPIFNLEQDNFQVDGRTISKVSSRYDDQYIVVYTIKCQGTLTLPVTVRVWDSRGIKVIARYP